MDIRKIKKLIEMLEESQLSEIEITEGEESIRLSRGAPSVSAGAPLLSQPLTPVSAPIEAAPVHAPQPAPPAPTSEVTQILDAAGTVNSPMVGTFYASANPDSPAFVKVGDSIGADTTVCIVEAMKVFNEINAEVSGKIVAVLVNDQDPVDCGKPMFKVDTRG